MEVALKTRIQTKKRVPHGARQEWSECLDLAVSEVIRHNDERAWAECQSLAKMVLRAPDRGGGKNRNKAAADTKKRCRDWLDGSRERLWKPSRGAEKEEPQAKKKVNEERLDELGKEGLWKATLGEEI